MKELNKDQKIFLMASLLTKQYDIEFSEEIDELLDLKSKVYDENIKKKSPFLAEREAYIEILKKLF